MSVMNNKKKTSKSGGKVVAAGGYGCVFNPALKCVNNKKREARYVSKLMLKKYALSEYNDIMKFKKDLEKIPNYEDYFLVEGFYTCEIDKITSSDLEDYDKKCRTLKRDGITEKNINDNLNKLISLNMPNGGIDLGDYLEKHYSFDDLIEINNSLINLLQKGIIPMNKMGIYHSDIKESNILIERNEKTPRVNARLIDWGLSAKIPHRPAKEIPSAMRSRPFQYNLPFSAILFNDLFDKTYRDFLKESPNPEYYMIRTFLIDYIFTWGQKRGVGHIEVIDSIFGKLFSMDITVVTPPELKQMIIEMEYTYNYILEYLATILLKYTKNGRFYMMDYFNNVYLHIVDVWGFIISYEPILTFLFSKYQTLTPVEMEIYKSLKHIFLKYLYEPRVEKISISHLVKDFKKLNHFFEIGRKNTVNLSTTKNNKPVSFSKTKKRSVKNKSKTQKTNGKKGNSGIDRENISSTIKSYLEKTSKEDRTASPSESIELNL